MLKVNLGILKDFINDRNHFCHEEREKLGLDVVFIANSNDSDNNIDKNLLYLLINKSYVPDTETKQNTR